MAIEGKTLKLEKKFKNPLKEILRANFNIKGI